MNRASSRHALPAALVGGLLALAAGGITAWATAASGATGYRTATATTATVEQTLTLTGTASPVDQATADFQVAGTVAAVDVAAGQTVTAGETLASLGTTTLQQAVTSAETSLEAAKATLAEDEAAEAAATTTTTTTTAPTTTTTTAPNSSSPSSPNGTLQEAQQAVVSAQQAADTAAQQAATALAQAQTACGSAPTSTTTTTSPTGSGTPTAGKGSPGSGTTTTGSSTKGSSTAGKGHITPSAATTTATCRAALQAVLAAQEQVSTDQKAVATAESSLAQLLAASGSGSPSGPGATGSGSGTKNPGATGTTGAGSSAATDPTTSPTTDPGGSSRDPSGGTKGATDGGNGVPTAAQLASDQASIDKATGALIEARQDLASAQLTSPIAGTVVSVGLAAGQSVSAGSATDAITVVSAGSFEMTASVSSSQATELQVGDTAEVTVDSTTAPLEGTVARVGPPDTGGSGTSITYPVVVALPAGTHGIRPGSAAQAVVVLRRAQGALVVPTSAVHTAGAGSSYVTVLRTGQATRRPVTVGIVGDIDTQITGGLSRGATVVLADRSAPLPSSSTRTTGPGTGGGPNRFSPGGGQFVERPVLRGP